MRQFRVLHLSLLALIACESSPQRPLDIGGRYEAHGKLVESCRSVDASLSLELIVDHTPGDSLLNIKLGPHGRTYYGAVVDDGSFCVGGRVQLGGIAGRFTKRGLRGNYGYMVACGGEEYSLEAERLDSKNTVPGRIPGEWEKPERITELCHDGLGDNAP